MIRVATVIRAILSFSGCLGCFGAFAYAASGDGFVPLFDGKTLQGWVNPFGHGKAWAEGGEIRMLSEKPFFLMTERRFGDFILEMELRVPDGSNSGVQFRSQFEKGKVWGYQAEVDTSPRRWTGGLYDQGRRKWLSPLEGKPEARAAYHNNDWNRIRVECIRDRIRILVNGVLTTDYIDSMDIEGHIGLQDHGRFRSKKSAIHRFRNIRIKDLGRREWVPLWSSHSLKGWRAYPEHAWRIENGEVVAVGKRASGAFLISDQSYSDFTVRLRVKPIQGSGGFCFRANEAKNPPWLGGLLIPIGANDLTGVITEVNRRMPLVRPLSPSDENSPHPTGGWRLISVSTHGQRIAVHLDGHLTSELFSEQGNPDGRLALLLDSGQNARFEFKDVEILSELIR